MRETRRSRHSSGRAAWVAAALALGAPLAAAGEGPVVWERWRQPHEVWDFPRFEVVSDVDGDGVRELLDGVDEVYDLRSGRTGEVLATLRRPEETPWSVGGAAAVIGDIDGDGTRELAAPSRRGLEILTLPEARILRTLPWPPWEESQGLIPFPDRIGDLGDVDGDGVPDLYTADTAYDPEGHPWPERIDNRGRVAAYSGADGRLLWEHFGAVWEARLGQASFVVGDLDGDGANDLAAGQSNPWEGVPPRLFFFDGRDGSILLERDLVPAFAEVTWTLFLPAGDLDGDGRLELFAGANSAPLGSRVGAGRIARVELPDFEIRWDVWGATGDSAARFGDAFGIHLRAAGDVDLDGVDDLLHVSSRIARTASSSLGHLYLRSGRTGELLQVYEARQSHAAAHYFDNVETIGDVDGDGRPEFVVTTDAHLADREDRGLIQVLRYQEELAPFSRGDADLDGRIRISDAVHVLRVLFGREPPGSCPAALDWDSDGAVGILDAYRLLVYLFVPTAPAPTPPFDECGRYVLIGGQEQLTPPLPCDAWPACE